MEWGPSHKIALRVKKEEKNKYGAPYTHLEAASVPTMSICQISQNSAARKKKGEKQIWRTLHSPRGRFREDRPSRPIVPALPSSRREPSSIRVVRARARYDTLSP